MTHDLDGNSELIERAERLRAAAKVRLTAEECRCLRMAASFGWSDQPHAPLESAIEKLRVIEAGG